MGRSTFSHSGWIAPIAIGVAGVLLSCFTFWMANQADDQRVQTILEFRSEWRARDLEAKIRLSGNAVENIAIAMAANNALGPDQFAQLAARAARGLEHVNSLQWAPRIKRDQIAAFEQTARSLGLSDYQVFDVTPDFQRTNLSDRPEYFPVLFDERLLGGRRVLGLALGKYDPRRIPMEKARDEGGAMATVPVRPVGPAAAGLVYLLFWPVYDTIDVPATIDQRRAHLRGYAIGNYNLTALIGAALRNTPEPIETLYFSVAGVHQENVVEKAAAFYSPASRKVELRDEKAGLIDKPAVRVARDFTVFGQHWDLTFDYSAAVVAALRSDAPWVWLLGGILSTGFLVLYVWREAGRTRAIAALVETRTAELQRTSEQLHQAQKMEAIGNLTGGMAHDFNNLLSVVIGNLDLLQDRVRHDQEAMALSEAALQASIRGAELTRQLLAFARRQPLAPSVIDVNELVVGMTRLLERILEENIEVVLITGQEVWPVLIDAAQLSSAIANLATNARDAMLRGGRLTIETKNTHLDADYAALNPGVIPGDYVLLEVSDTGTGMAPEVLNQVFEPFFTTKEVGQGTGLGLSMVFGFVKQSKGHIKIYSELGHGTIVRIYLPRAEKAPDTIAAAAEVSRPQAAHESILVVEDDPHVRSVVTRQIMELGYPVIEATNAKEALALVKDPQTRIDLLFTDLVMPGDVNGYELARTAIAERPGLTVLFTSGYSSSTLRGEEWLTEADHFLSKPYRKQDLARKLQEIFGN
ncbi:MAG TPA: CHASE domain-containing protein [Dongiaceae bacterium]|jgi:signal transduction histidine kinase/ActR/RegA family two-component response regulator|nr:CHASE domain-containing protein [Dongiaceae bacterium]